MLKVNQGCMEFLVDACHKMRGEEMEWNQLIDVLDQCCSASFLKSLDVLLSKLKLSGFFHFLLIQIISRTLATTMPSAQVQYVTEKTHLWNRAMVWSACLCLDGLPVSHFMTLSNAPWLRPILILKSVSTQHQCCQHHSCRYTCWHRPVKLRGSLDSPSVQHLTVLCLQPITDHHHLSYYHTVLNFLLGHNNKSK